MKTKRCSVFGTILGLALVLAIIVVTLVLRTPQSVDYNHIADKLHIHYMVIRFPSEMPGVPGEVISQMHHDAITDFIPPNHVEIMFLGTLDEVRVWEQESETIYNLTQAEELTGIPLESRQSFIHAVYDFYDEHENLTRYLGVFMSQENFESLYASEAKDFEVVFIGTHEEVKEHIGVTP